MNESSALVQSSLHALAEQVRRRCGIHIGDRDANRLKQGLDISAKARGASLSALVDQLLLGDADAWEALLDQLTVGETYFFRDPGQLRLLAQRILPELIECHRADRQLRLWSAGCSTGEEVYSLAMLIDEILPERRDWSVQIVGTDIARSALAVAQRARYGDHAVRHVDESRLKRYFQRDGDSWLVEESLRGMVRFDRGNLMNLAECPPQNGFGAPDLILCRNVFIYFDPDTTALTATRLADCLRPGGYLVTGHTELFGAIPSPLEARLYPESMVYRRSSAPSPPARDAVAAPSIPQLQRPLRRPPPAPARPRMDSPAPVPASSRAGPTPPPEPAGAAEYRSGDYAGALARALASEPRTLEQLLLVARCYANLGAYAEAADWARRARAADPLDFRADYLLAHLAELADDTDVARDCLRRVIYLEPDFVPAHLDLGALLERAGNSAGARRERRAGLALLGNLPAEAEVEPYVGLTAGELQRYVAGLLDETDPLAAA